ncbi:MAG TPA: flagellar export chaperone FliS [Holophagaceae bacterium]
MQPYARANDQYLVQRINGATPQQLVALLLEGSQRFLNQAMQAMERKDFGAKAHYVNRVLAIVEELVIRLDHENGGELAGNLVRVYDWWTREILQAGASKDVRRLERIHWQMGELRQAWEQADQPRKGAPVPTDFQVRDMVG